jgi:hypothetical protein
MDLWEKLTDLETWVGSKQADGYIHFTYTENGTVTMLCGKEFSIPPKDIKSPGGWVGEVIFGWSDKTAEINPEPGEHFWSYSPNFVEMVHLHDSIVLGRNCGCKNDNTIRNVAN